jgi:transposase InsO family protein
MVLLVVEQGLAVAEVARRFMVSRPTVYKWIKRWQAGDHELKDRSSRPLTSPRRLDSIQVALIRLCRQGRLVITAIARQLGLVRSTVGRYVNALGLGRLSRLLEPVPVRRYEKLRPGQLLHLDVKKLRGFTHAGRKYIDRGGYRQRRAPRICLHVCVDDYSRYAYVELLPRENAEACCGFLSRAVAHFAALGVKVEGILTDNAKAYCSKALARLCSELELKHHRTRPYRPQTNGKAERFIRSASDEWANLYYDNSADRDERLPAWIHHYNHHRPHHALNLLPPASRMPNCQQPVET